MVKIKQLLKNWRVIILLIALLLAIVAIHPAPTVDGVTIRSVVKNSSASNAGIVSPKPTAPPLSKERVIAINNIPIHNIDDYFNIVSGLEPNITIQVKTTKRLYRLITKYQTETIKLNETETVSYVEEIYNETLNKTVNITKTEEVQKTIIKILSNESVDLGLRIYNAPKTNIRKGLDLEGGTRVLLQPEKKLSKDDMDILVSNMKQRLNVYGISDVVIREAGDLSGNQYILIEIAGANEEEVKELLAKQGKFEAKIGEDVVFRGDRDIRYVCRSAECSGIDPQRGCNQDSDGRWFCTFRFSISLSPESAQRQADLTKDLDVITEGNFDYLSKKLDLYLDDALVDSLNIGSDLKGRAVTDIAISGPGTGATQQEAVFDSLKSMKRLQTILITGSLPVKIDIVKTDSISPILGGEFVRNAIIMALFAIVAVTLIIVIRYRKIQIAIPIMITSLSEVIIILGVAALIGWNLDLAAIAGIIIAVGTGVDHQIIITDETLKGQIQAYSLLQRIKRAFFIIMAAYFTTMVAMIPLLFAGAGLLKGFALTTMIGISAGVFITRPAFAAMIGFVLRE